MHKGSVLSRIGRIHKHKFSSRNAADDAMPTTFTEDWQDYNVFTMPTTSFSHNFGASIDSGIWEVGNVGAATINNGATFGENSFYVSSTTNPSYIVAKSTELSSVNMILKARLVNNSVRGNVGFGVRNSADGDGYWVMCVDAGGFQAWRIYSRSAGVMTGLATVVWLGPSSTIHNCYFMIVGSDLVFIAINESNHLVYTVTPVYNNTTFTGAGSIAVGKAIADSALASWAEDLLVTTP